VRHRVGAYTREGKRVDSYLRGHGQKSSTISKTIPKYFDDSTKLGPKGWTINFKYSERKGDGESVIVIANSYESALDQSFETRTEKDRFPISIEIVDPSLGSIISVLRTGRISPEVQKEAEFETRETLHGAGEALKGFGRGQMAEGKRKFGELLHGGDIDKLLKNSYSSDPAIRTRSRAELKRKYPEVYAHADFAPQRVETVSIHGKGYGEEVAERREAEAKKAKEKKERKKVFYGEKPKPVEVAPKPKPTARDAFRGKPEQEELYRKGLAAVEAEMRENRGESTISDVKRATQNQLERDLEVNK
jgi:hypothetical protein